MSRKTREEVDIEKEKIEIFCNSFTFVEYMY